MYRGNLLERALQDLSYNLWKFRTAPFNPLYAHLPSTITVSLADLPIRMVLSPATGSSDESWAHLGSGESGRIDDYDAESETSSASGDGVIGGKYHKEVKIEPWQTLLLVEDRAKERAKETAAAVVGLGDWVNTERRNSVWDSETGSTRRGSKETQAEEDESNLMKSLIEACDVTRP